MKNPEITQALYIVFHSVLLSTRRARRSFSSLAVTLRSVTRHSNQTAHLANGSRAAPLATHREEMPLKALCALSAQAAATAPASLPTL